jgi:hypothetical protein
MLCLLGDMGVAESPSYQSLVARAAARHERVFLVPGGCEYSFSDKSVATTDVFLERLSRAYPNVHLLQKTALPVRSDVVVAGSTMRLHNLDRRYPSHLEHCLHTFKDAEERGWRLLYLTYKAPHPRHVKALGIDMEDRVLLQGAGCDGERVIDF